MSGWVLIMAKILEVNTVYIPTILFGAFLARSPSASNHLFLVPSTVTLVTGWVGSEPRKVFWDSVRVRPKNAAGSHWHGSSYKGSTCHV
jgi:hypothetical protein